VASKQPEEAKPAPKKEAPVERAAKGSAAVAKTTPAATPVGKEATIPAKGPEERSGIAQVLRPQPVLGNKSAAEALINERRTGE
jgi:hypothetical protein